MPEIKLYLLFMIFLFINKCTEKEIHRSSWCEGGINYTLFINRSIGRSLSVVGKSETSHFHDIQDRQRICM